MPEGPGREQFLKNRERVVSQSIDNFCLSRAPRYAGFFEAYAEMIEQMPDILISRYEDMISDFETWLQRLLNYLDVPSSDPIVRQIIRDADFEVGEEDVERHKRRVVPGDFLDKLAPATIDELNELFAQTLHSFDYPLITPRYTLWRKQG